MATFKYVAKDSSSRTTKGKLIADSRDAVINELRKRNLIIISLKETKETTLGKMKLFTKKVKADELVIFSRQLATMVDAGIPLMQSLDALREQIKGGEFKKVIGRIRDDIERGASLSASFSKHPHVFNELYISMVKAGETSGMLNVILERVAVYLEKTAALKRKIKSAMIYPIIVFTMAVLITTFLMIKVVPTFTGIFEMLGGQLPLPTRILIAISNIFRTGLPYFLGAVVIFGFIVSRYVRTDKGRVQLDQLKLRLPIFGPLFRKVAVSRFARTLSTLIQSGVPILASLEIVGKTSGSRVIELAVNNVRSNVREGESIAVPLIKSGIFPPMVTRMISVGEQTGELEKMLGKISDFYDEQVDAAVTGLTSAIEPIIIIFLGVVIGGIVISLFLPIFKITQLIGGGI